MTSPARRGVVQGSCLPAAAALAAMAAGCAPALVQQAGDAPRARYERELARVRPDGASQARAWADAGNAAARAALPVALPFDETVYFPTDQPGAVAYRFTLRRADRFHVRVEPPRLRERGVFLELFEVVPGERERLLLIAQSRAGEHTLRSLVPRTGDYVLLVQPRLEHSGRYRLALGSGAEVPLAMPADALALGGALVFPVAGRSDRGIGSGFGAPRDGGRRVHEGVDIFAPRGTPVLAAADGEITQVATTAVGGRVIWQRLEGSGLELYYAHLHEQHVRRGQKVRAGDVIGTVGNTGNARTTPPHLHFGVYSPGRTPIDPAPLLATGRLATDRPVARAPAPEPEPPPANDGAQPDIGALGSWLRTATPETALRPAPSTASPGLTLLPAGTPVRLIGGSAAWYRVALPDGVAGFIALRDVAQLGQPVYATSVVRRTPLREHAAPGARTLETIYGGEPVDVLAEWRGHLLVRTVSGRVGWISDAEEVDGGRG